MADVRVTCIIKPNVNSPHEHITHLGGSNWLWTRDQVIESIDRSINTFFVIDSTSGKRSDVAVVRESGRHPYLRTHADGLWNNNLLSLNQCRA